MHYLNEPFSWALLWDGFARGGPAVVALMVGVLAFFVAHRQYHVARAKLNLDLFERRMVIFDKVWSYSSEATSHAEERTAYGEFHNAIPEAYFLFGPEIGDFMRDLETRVAQYDGVLRRVATLERLSRPWEDARASVIAHETHFRTRCSTMALRELFGPYMDFSLWPGRTSIWLRLGRFLKSVWLEGLPAALR